MSQELTRTLRKIRGALFTARAPISGHPRPFQPDNVCTTAGCNGRSPEERQIILDVYREHRYTHGPIGPFIDPGYHGLSPAMDFRVDDGESAVATLEQMWGAGIAPITFLVPDNWKIDEAEREMGHIFRRNRWQAAAKLVCVGWEPSKDRSNAEWVEQLRWVADTFPHSLRYMHMCADFDAPGNNDDLTPGSPRFIGNEGCWNRVAGLIHGYLSQSAAFEHPNHIDSDPRANGRTDFMQWKDRYNIHEPSSLIGRFITGYAGWPTFSANPGERLDVIAYEYASFWCYNDNRPEDEAMNWGDAALEMGADGVCDGFHADRDTGARRIAPATAERTRAMTLVTIANAHEQSEMALRHDEQTMPGRPGGGPRRKR